MVARAHLRAGSKVEGDLGSQLVLRAGSMIVLQACTPTANVDQHVRRDPSYTLHISAVPLLGRNGLLREDRSYVLLDGAQTKAFAEITSSLAEDRWGDCASLRWRTGDLGRGEPLCVPLGPKIQGVKALTNFFNSVHESFLAALRQSSTPRDTSLSLHSYSAVVFYYPPNGPEKSERRLLLELLSIWLAEEFGLASLAFAGAATSQASIRAGLAKLVDSAGAHPGLCQEVSNCDKALSALLAWVHTCLTKTGVQGAGGYYQWREAVSAALEAYEKAACFTPHRTTVVTLLDLFRPRDQQKFPTTRKEGRITDSDRDRSHASLSSPVRRHLQANAEDERRRAAKAEDERRRAAQAEDERRSAPQAEKERRSAFQAEGEPSSAPQAEKERRSAFRAEDEPSSAPRGENCEGPRDLLQEWREKTMLLSRQRIQAEMESRWMDSSPVKHTLLGFQPHVSPPR